MRRSRRPRPVRCLQIAGPDWSLATMPRTACDFGAVWSSFGKAWERHDPVRLGHRTHGRGAVIHVGPDGRVDALLRHPLHAGDRAFGIVLVSEGHELDVVGRVAGGVAAHPVDSGGPRLDAQGRMALTAHIDEEKAARRAENRREIVRQSGKFHALVATVSGVGFPTRTLRNLVMRTSLIVATSGSVTLSSFGDVAHERIREAIGAAMPDARRTSRESISNPSPRRSTSPERGRLNRTWSACCGPTADDRLRSRLRDGPIAWRFEAGRAASVPRTHRL